MSLKAVNLTRQLIKSTSSQYEGRIRVQTSKIKDNNILLRKGFFFLTESAAKQVRRIRSNVKNSREDKDRMKSGR